MKSSLSYPNEVTSNLSLVKLLNENTHGVITMEKELVRTPTHRIQSNPSIKMASVDLVLDRLKCHFEAEDDAALSHKLGFSRGLVSNWRKRNTMAYHHVIKIALREGLSLDFLFTEDSGGHDV